MKCLKVAQVGVAIVQRSRAMEEDACSLKIWWYGQRVRPPATPGPIAHKATQRELGIHHLIGGSPPASVGSKLEWADCGAIGSWPIHALAGTGGDETQMFPANACRPVCSDRPALTAQRTPQPVTCKLTYQLTLYRDKMAGSCCAALRRQGNISQCTDLGCRKQLLCARCLVVR